MIRLHCGSDTDYLIQKAAIAEGFKSSIFRDMGDLMEEGLYLVPRRVNQSALIITEAPPNRRMML
ncbi:hypothetical protein SAY87_002300 [Trapa incisa]|uniref:Uncharacterized protein n=1 Tax=Trapa incisa TaxID=236973 RepID=A0AAN7JUK0_9MYRT|nr:hypothetical protein SAY87_002300 [Trapa incisa]